MTTENRATSLPELVDAKFISELLKLHWRTVMIMAREGRIPCVRVGVSLRFDVAVIREWLASKAIPAKDNV